MSRRALVPVFLILMALLVLGRVVVTYVNLLPVALLVTRRYPHAAVTVVVHGSEIWAPQLPRRTLLRT